MQQNDFKLIPGQVIGNRMVISLSPCTCGSVELKGIYVCGEYAIKCLSCGRVGGFHSGTKTCAVEWSDTYDRKTQAARLARQFIKQNYLIVDTETTGLGDDAEIVEISVINCLGTVIMDSLIKPSKPIPEDVIKIHGITNDMVESAPAWGEVAEYVSQLFMKNRVTAYNLSFDARLIEQTCIIAQTPAMHLLNPVPDCTMLAYADFYGEPGKHGGCKWQSLTNAAKQQGIEIGGKSHRSLTDCFTTLALINKMAEWGIK